HDSYASHIRDTKIAGAGLCHDDAVDVVVHEGPARVRELMDMGVQFSREHGRIDLGREGGHSFSRIIHVKDVTGREVERALVHRVARNKNITVLEHQVAIDFVLERTQAGIRCAGALAFDEEHSVLKTFTADFVLLCTGGAGQVYLHTTNPSIATGDGVAMAYRAGAAIADMEFIQFHPTALFSREESEQIFLISEAVRGFGGVLRTKDGMRFMTKYDKRAELAPRDIVARAIDAEMKKRGDECVYLDLTHLNARKVKNHFPNIYKHCRKQGIDITKDMIPVVPAAHYSCGGVATDLYGRTSLKDLYACGEVTCTGLHGANRLASNSLLEALVFSTRAADDINRRSLLKKKLSAKQKIILPLKNMSRKKFDEAGWVVVSHNRNLLKQVMWDYVGIVRSNELLKRAKRKIAAIQNEVEEFYASEPYHPDVIELRNMTETARIIVECALQRKESRGLHYNTDYPRRDDKNWHRDTYIRRKISA
ncbi:MAG TPA: L-aspartate oxidase, partial [Candidatus Kapabacteria bacterium]|nr:L-aspartate oxidase [Candidatus Kapabacteria bacterium]